MDAKQEVPEKRFADYQQVFNSEGVAIGFTLPGSQFLFKYDLEGGWKDQRGNHYNSEGVLTKIKDDHSDQDEEDDQQILDQFERMLQQDQHGLPKAKKQPKKETQKQNQQQKQQPESYSSETTKLLQQYKNKQNVREGLPVQLHIFFKMRTKYFQRIKPSVESAQGVAQGNSIVKKIKAQAAQKQKKLKQNNKWITGDSQFQYSGAQLDEATYDRYWYGFVKATPQNYKQILQQIEKSQQFALLEHKSFYALKSKFYLKKKMKETIGQLGKCFQGKEDDDLVKILVNNLPQNFPTSFILDLCSFSDTNTDEIYSINLVDEYTAQLMISKKGALKFLNVQGYCHDEKEYIELDVELDKQGRKLKKSGLFKIGVETDRRNPYKTHTRQLNDTLGLQKSREELAKLYTEQQQAKNGGYRIVVGRPYLKKVLMFRGNSLNVLKVEVLSK